MVESADLEAPEPDEDAEAMDTLVDLPAAPRPGDGVDSGGSGPQPRAKDAREERIAQPGSSA